VSRSSRHILLCILLVALLLRIALVFAQPVTAKSVDRLPDQREYLSLAQNLLKSHALFFVDPRFNQPVFAYRLPGYPLLIAGCGASVLTIRLVQCAIDTSTVLAVFLITRRLTTSANTALVAAALVACNPFSIYFTNLLLSETLFCALLTWGICLLLHPVRGSFILGTVLLMVDSYVKSTGLLMFPAVVFACLLNFNNPGSYRLSKLRRVCLLSASACAVLFLAMVPWAWRNHKVLGARIWTTTNSGFTLYDGFNPSATGASNQRFITRLPGLMSMNEVQRSDFLAHEARSWAVAHWMRIPALSTVKVLRGWSPVPLSEDYGKPVYRLISAVYAVPFDLVCLAGLFSPRLNRRAKLLVVMPALVVTLGQVISVGSLRYRMPGEAPLAVLAAVGVMDLLRKRKFEERNAE
jgi:hypothetical protein